MKTALSASPRRWLWPLLTALVVGYFGFVGWTYHQGYQRAARGEKPLFTDFTSTYGAALLLRKEAPEFLYHQQHMTAAHEEAANAAYGGTLSETQRKIGFNPFMYPPTFVPFVLPFGYLSYGAALVAWLALTAIPYLLATRCILNRDTGVALGVALAAPPFFYNVMFGQTSFLPAGFIGLGLYCLPRRPWLAGVLIGMASIKPHFGLLIPIALLAGGHWRAFASASATVVALVLATVFAFGMEPWYAFIGVSLFHMEGFEYGAYAWNVMTTVLSAMHLIGAKLDTAWTVQSWVSAGCALLVAWVWWRGRHRGDSYNARCAVLCSALPLALPFMFLYDLVLLVMAVAWLVRDLQDRGSRPWEWVVVAGAMVGILLVKPLGAVPGIPVAVFSIASLFLLSLYRFRYDASR